jgi:hypothetical protein
MSLTLDGSASVTINSGAILGITSGTAVASTSGTSIDFTSIPSWVKRITVMFNGVSLSGSSNYLIQIGAGSITSSGYVSGSTYQGSANVVGNIVSTAGFAVSSGAGAANVISGSVVLLSVGGNIWVSNHTMGLNSSGVGYSFSGGGNLSLGGTLDRVRITTVNGTDTFDAGSINILYE